MSGRTKTAKHARVSAGLFALAVLATPGVARAANGINPRTPVVWDGAPCMTVVDRSQDPILHIPYAVPREDTEITEDEVETSRRHQFFAFCRQHHSQDFLPNWVSQADIEDAASVGLVDPMMVDPENVLETSTVWADCWYRINGDDERRPITYAAAEEGVEWDTSTVPAGVYRLDGYTWEPQFNLWVQRPGVVKIVDGPDDDTVGPAAAVTSGEQILYSGQTALIEGCVDAAEGSTFTAYYASTEGAELEDYEPQWVPFLEGQPIEGPDLAFDFTAPEEEAGNQVMIRVDVTDPSDRTYTAHQEDLVVLLEGSDPNECDEDATIIGNPGCATGGESGGSDSGDGDATGDGGDMATSGGDGTGTGGDDDTAGQDGGGGGGCSVAPTSRGGLAGLLLLGILGSLGMVRRRRR